MNRLTRTAATNGVVYSFSWLPSPELVTFPDYWFRPARACGLSHHRGPLCPGSSHLVEDGPRFYDEDMSTLALPGGVVHDLPDDLARALLASATAQAAWEDITPLARNEFICWVQDAKKQQTRERRIRRTVEELNDGMRRPCCWPGCSHRERSARK